jgi:hypothetical protein
LTAKVLGFSFNRRWLVLKNASAEITSNINLLKVLTNTFSTHKTTTTLCYPSAQTITPYNSLIAAFTKTLPLSSSILGIVSSFYNGKQAKSFASQIVYFHYYHPSKLYHKSGKMSIYENPELLEVSE